MLIGELSRATGASARSLRYYEEQGLLVPARTASGYREYGPRAPESVRRIRALLAMGLPSAAIRELLPCEQSGPDAGSCAGLQERLAALGASMTVEAAELQRRSAALSAYVTESFSPQPAG